MSFLASSSRRSSGNSLFSSATHGSEALGPEDPSMTYTEVPIPVHSDSSSDWPDDCSDKESLQSWAKEQQEKEAEEEGEMLSTKEGQRLRRWFILITIALTVVGIGVSIFTYYYLQGKEEENFEKFFDATSHAIIDSAEFHMKVLERALLSRAEQLTTHAVFTASFWPFVSLPDFSSQGRNFLIETETQMVAWAPVITNDRNLRAWEAYSTYMLENSGWFPPDEAEERLKKQLERLKEQAKSRQRGETLSNAVSGLYVPLWQISPWVYNIWINHNLTEQFEESILLLLRSKRQVWTRYFDIAELRNAHHNPNSTVADGHLATMAPSTEEDTAMVSFLFQPIFRNLRSHDVSYEDTTNITYDSSEVVGIYMVAVEWAAFLNSMVPEGTPEVHLVLQNPWGEALSYHVAKNVEGASSVILFESSTDHHANAYGSMAQTIDLTTPVVVALPNKNATVASATVASNFADKASGSAASSAGVLGNGHGIQGDIDNVVTRSGAHADYGAGSGHLQLAIYPTPNFEDTYTSREPLTYTLVMAAVVFFAIAVFFLYSRFVHNRQQKLVETASRTALVVKSLFPSNVRDRIMQEAEQSELKNKAKRQKKQRQSLDLINTEGQVAAASNSSALGGVSVGSAGSRTSRGRRYRRPSIDIRGFGRRNSSEERSVGDSGRELNASTSQVNFSSENPYGSKPIADHFSATTVLFADMVGFTAWSSVREPTSVFTLLETIYHAFDKVAKKRGIFKVETIGDCYVAVCGLPVPRPDHALAMAYFANDCIRKMKILVKKLEVSLGPDTADLSMRVGLHSGPVTAGVLRGEKSRFQLFGDTVNTAARMETNGQKDCIHVSEETANLLINAGKERWLTARDEKVHAKGKGELQTYWLVVRSMSSYNAPRPGESRRASNDSGATDDLDIDIDDASTLDDSNSDLVPETPNWEKVLSEKDIPSGESRAPVLNDRFQRLVDWNVDQLVSLLKKIVAKRNGMVNLATDAEFSSQPRGEDFDLRSDATIWQEVTEVIPFPKPSVSDLVAAGDSSGQAADVELDPAAISQLHAYMTNVASLYNDNPFHNFAHASHVTMALITWLSRIARPDPNSKKEKMYKVPPSGDWKRRSKQSNDVYSLQADSLTHFALVFAALIHDLEHSGVPNSQLVKEKAQIATLYNERSVHEQASVDSAFETLMDDKYSKFRNLLFATEEEFYRFRQIVINTVMATDVLDKKVMAKQSVRWGCLFREDDDDGSDSDYEPENESDQKTSIVVERLLVISDIAHTMQHWYVYRKWNEKLFEEHYLAFKAGRADNDPSLTWYDDELVFFDKYVIPMATKMKDCQLFDSSCDEYVRYATSNREQWENIGREEVASMVGRFQEIQFEVKDNYNPVSDGRIFSPSNASPRAKRDWKQALATFQDG